MRIWFMFDNHTFADAPTQEKARELFARDGCGSLFARDSRGNTLRPALHGRRREDGTYGVSDDDLAQFYAKVEELANWEARG